MYTTPSPTNIIYISIEHLKRNIWLDCESCSFNIIIFVNNQVTESSQFSPHGHTSHAMHVNSFYRYMHPIICIIKSMVYMMMLDMVNSDYVGLGTQLWWLSSDLAIMFYVEVTYCRS